jgi:hypothetical protein
MPVMPSSAQLGLPSLRFAMTLGLILLHRGKPVIARQPLAAYRFD